MAHAWLVFSAPEVVLLAGLADSEPVVWVGLVPSGDFSGFEAGVLGVLGLLLEPEEAGEDGLLDKPEPGVELPDMPEAGVPPPALVDVTELPPAKACPGVPELLAPEPVMPESLPLELPGAEPATPVSLPLEVLVPEPAIPLSLPLELLVLEFPGALPPALVDETPGLEFVCPVSTPVPEPLVPVGRVSVLPALLGRFDEVLRPLPTLELDGVPPD